MNQFLPLKARIEWRWTDIACLRKSGNFGDDFNEECRSFAEKVGISAQGQRQTGVIRVNCVDCLDRTNLTQVNIGLVALQMQLKALDSTLSVTKDPCGEIFQKVFKQIAENNDNNHINNDHNHIDDN